MIAEGVKSALEQQSQQGNNSLRETAVTQPKTGMEKPKDFAMKSPSDTTIYVPALRLNNPANLITQPTNSIPVNSDVNNIANFVENIRLQVKSQEANNIDSILDVAKEAPRQQILGEPGQSSQTLSRPPVEKADPIMVAGQQDKNLMDQAREEATNAVVHAEQQKALIDPVQGMPNFMPETQSFGISQDHYSDLVDDEFFHITCHVEPSLRSKIEAGQFVDFGKSAN